MTKNTKTLLTIGGIAVVGYILWKQGVFGKKSGSKSFAGFTANEDYLNFRGTTSRTRVGGLPICRQGCQNSAGQLIRTGSGQTGQCAVQIHDIEGNVSSLAIYNCTGTTEADLSLAYTTTAA